MYSIAICQHRHIFIVKKRNKVTLYICLYLHLVFCDIYKLTGQVKNLLHSVPSLGFLIKVTVVPVYHHTSIASIPLAFSLSRVCVCACVCACSGTFCLTIPANRSRLQQNSDLLSYSLLLSEPWKPDLHINLVFSLQHAVSQESFFMQPLCLFLLGNSPLLLPQHATLCFCRVYFSNPNASYIFLNFSLLISASSFIRW